MAEISKSSYHSHVKSLKSVLGNVEAMKSAIGDGGYECFGILQRELLVQCGLPKNGYLIEIGCGSGRLAGQLAKYLKGDYLGFDIVPDLVNHARNSANCDHWRFVVPKTEFAIPDEDNKADMICCFSVFTHLLHEQTYTYLKDAVRVLKPGGKVVFSFLEFKLDSHWRVFEETVENLENSLLNQFISRDAILAWAKHLNLEVEGIFDGDKPHFKLSESVTLGDGQIFKDEGHLGQSVCVLSKPHSLETSSGDAAN